MRQTEGRRHVGIHFEGNLPEVVEVLSGEDDRLQLVRRAVAFLLSRWHEVHFRKTAPIEE